MKVSKGEPESPLQEASIGVPQTPSNSELVLQLAYLTAPDGQKDKIQLQTQCTVAHAQLLYVSSCCHDARPGV